MFTSSQPMVTLVSLQPFTTYQIRISAQNNAGWGGNSSERNVNTLTRGCVCVYLCVGVTTNSIHPFSLSTDEVLASNITYSTPRVGVSLYTVELRWEVPK